MMALPSVHLADTPMPVRPSEVIVQKESGTWKVMRIFPVASATEPAAPTTKPPTLGTPQVAPGLVRSDTLPTPPLATGLLTASSTTKTGTVYWPLLHWRTKSTPPPARRCGYSLTKNGVAVGCGLARIAGGGL